MNRAVVVLLLLIANALFSPSKINPPDPRPRPPQDYSLGLLTVVDGAALKPPEQSRSGCVAAADRL